GIRWDFNPRRLELQLGWLSSHDGDRGGSCRWGSRRGGRLLCGAVENELDNGIGCGHALVLVNRPERGGDEDHVGIDGAHGHADWQSEAALLALRALGFSAARRWLRCRALTLAVVI